eukprot:3061060-Pyramimonas_sp.AAC.2
MAVACRSSSLESDFCQHAGPDTVMELNATLWEGTWTDSVDERTGIIEHVAQLRREAKDEDLPDIALDQMDHVINA